jgi:hypothetical protein
MLRVLLNILLAVFSPLALASECGPLLHRLVYEAQRASLGHTDNPVAALRQDFLNRFGIDVLDRSDPSSIFHLESDILNLFSVAPSLRKFAVEGLKEKWKLEDQQVQDLITFYGLRVFYNDVGIVGDPKTTFERLSEVNRTHWLTDTMTPSHSLQRRYSFYLSQVTNLSVPEMAQLLHLSEGQVYSDLWALGISLNKVFNEPIGKTRSETAIAQLKQLGFTVGPGTVDSGVGLASAARSLAALGLTTEQIAIVLSCGRSAIEFIRHHLADERRSVSWDRRLPYKGQKEYEPQILVDMFLQGMSHQRIADELNALASITDPNHPDIRTVASVAGKIQQLGLAKVVPNRSPVLSADIAQYVLAHPELNDDAICAHFDITPARLASIYKDFFLVRSSDGKMESNASKHSKRTLERYKEQVDLADAYLDFFLANGRIPNPTDFRVNTPGKIPVKQSRFYGNDDYGPGGTQHERRVFDGMKEALLAVKARSVHRGIFFPLSKVENWPGGITPTLRRVFQEEAVEYAIQWLEKNPGQPLIRSLFGHNGPIPILSARVWASGDYRLGGVREEKRIFDSRETFLLAVKAEAVRRGIPYYLYKEKLAATPSSAYREITADETRNLVLEWIARNGRMPTRADFQEPKPTTSNEAETADTIPIPQSKFFGTDTYSVGGDRHPYRMHDSAPDAWEKTWRQGQKLGINVDLLSPDISIRSERTEGFTQIQQSIAIDLMLAWAKSHSGVLPSLKELGVGPGHAGLTARRLYGGENGGVFPTPEAAKKAIEDEAQRRGQAVVWPQEARFQRGVGVPKSGSAPVDDDET